MVAFVQADASDQVVAIDLVVVFGLVVAFDLVVVFDLVVAFVQVAAYHEATVPLVEAVHVEESQGTETIPCLDLPWQEMHHEEIGNGVVVVVAVAAERDAAAVA